MNCKKSEKKNSSRSFIFQLCRPPLNYHLWTFPYNMIQSWYPDEEAKFSEDFSLASRLELIAMRCYQWWWLGKITKDISWSRKMIVVNNNLLGVFLSSLVAEGFHFFFPQWSNFINSTPKLFTRVIKLLKICLPYARQYNLRFVYFLPTFWR